MTHANQGLIDQIGLHLPTRRAFWQEVAARGAPIILQKHLGLTPNSQDSCFLTIH